MAHSLEDALSRERFTESDYLRHLVRVITTLGERGSAVIIGRGSPFLLPPGRALRVLVVAPRAMRLENVAKRRSLPAGDAEAALEAEDAARLAFHRHHFARNPDDAVHYDLTLNLGMLPMDAACGLLVRALEARFAGPGALPELPGAARPRLGRRPATGASGVSSASKSSWRSRPFSAARSIAADPSQEVPP